MFTLVINGKPIAVTKGYESEARYRFNEPDFTNRLRAIESDGQPVWNGADPFEVRPATGSEARALVEYAEKMGLEDEEEGEIVLYLQPVDAGDDFDETQDG